MGHDPAGAVYFSYDARGNVAGQIRGFTEIPFPLAGGRAGDGGLDFVTRMQYDAMDRLTRLTYPNGMTVTYDYNAQNLLERIPGYVDDVDYTASGQWASIAYANGVTTTYDYDERQRMRRMQSTNGEVALQDMAYAFDGVSNIVSITDNRPDRTDENDQTQVFAYDALYRLAEATGTYKRIEYAYNAIGNMIRKTSTAADPRLNLGTMRYGENGAGPHALTYADGETYTYDANGNLAQRGDTAFTWDARDRLLQVSDGVLTSTHGYDAEGQRVWKVVEQGGVTTSTLYLGQYAEIRGDELMQYVFADEERTAEIATTFDSVRLIRGFDGDVDSDSSFSAEKTWYLTDHLGGTNLLVDKSGQALSEIAYYPYGLTRHEQNADDMPYQFTGKELDESALYYYGARYYDANVGQFLTVDPLYVEESSEDKLQDAQNLNLYIYASNSPIQRIDRNGLDDKPIVDSTSNDKTANASPGSKLGLVIDHSRPTLEDIVKKGQKYLNAVAKPLEMMADTADKTANALADYNVPQMGPINEMGMRFTAEELRSMANDIKKPWIMAAKEMAERMDPRVKYVLMINSGAKAIKKGVQHRIKPRDDS